MPDDIDLNQILDVALAQHEAGQLELAENGYRAVLGHNPNEPDALNLLGVLLQERGRLEDSIALIKRALAIEPDFPEALTNLARALRATGESAAASDLAQRAIELEPGLAEAHLQLGRSLLDQNDASGAVQPLRRAAALAPGSVDAFLHLGVAMMRNNDAHGAITALTTALGLDPNRTEAMIFYGVVLENTGRLDEAGRWHEKAVATAPDDPATHAALAVTANRRLDPITSIAACRRTLDLQPDRVDMVVLLGSNLAALGQFADAEACWRKALELEPGSAAAQRGLAGIGRHSENTAEIARLRETLQNAATPSAERVAAGFAVGAMCDRSGDYDSAFAAFELANKLVHANQLKAGRGFDRVGLRQYVDWAISHFREPLFSATADWGNPSELPVFIVGMPRSGTSLVEQIAASHNQVIGAGERKDIGEIIRALDGGNLHRSPTAWARDAVSRAASAQVARLRSLGNQAERVIDKLPDNIQTLGQIAVLFPNARVIVCRRDLRDVCLSCYFQHFADGLSWTCDQTDLAARALEIERLMDHWRAVLPLQTLEIDYEALIAGLEGESRRLIAFLGLEWDPNCLSFDTTQRLVTTASYWQVRQPLYASSVGRWRHYERHLGPLLRGLNGSIPADDEGSAC